MNWDNIDAEMTPWRTRVKNLQTQLGIGASKGCFDCDHFTSCHASISNQPILKGDWTYVGHKYGQASVGGKPAKILFISLDRGGQGNGYEKFKATQQGFHTAAYERENSHMGGVDVELEHLLDETSPEDRCQQFALTNSVRCRRKSGSMRYEATGIMEKNCESHTKAIKGQEVLFLLTAHPARYPGFGWKKGYLPNELNNAFKRAKEIYSGI